MEPMDQSPKNDKNDPLDRLWAEYRRAWPDAEPSASFMPQLWQRIESRRPSMSSAWFRLWAEVWLAATLALAIVMGAILIPRWQNPPAYQASYVDVLVAADAANDGAVLTGGESE